MCQISCNQWCLNVEYLKGRKSTEDFTFPGVVQETFSLGRGRETRGCIMDAFTKSGQLFFELGLMHSG